jgi:predicted dehydrogenase
VTSEIRRTVRFGVIELGNIGALHSRTLLTGLVKRAELAAVCDSDPARLGPYAGRTGARARDPV